MPIQVRDGRQVSLEGGIQVITSPERTTTTIVDNGRVVTVTTPPGGGTPVVTLNGHETREPRVLSGAIERVAAAASRQPRVIREVSTIRVNGRALSQKEVIAGSMAAGGAATFVGLVALYAIARTIRRVTRRHAPATPAVAAAAPHVEPHVAPRIDRLEQAIESIAVEMERVAEAQRYSAKLLTERLPEASSSTARRAPAPERVVTPH